MLLVSLLICNTALGHRSSDDYWPDEGQREAETNAEISSEDELAMQMGESAPISANEMNRIE